MGAHYLTNQVAGNRRYDEKALGEMKTAHQTVNGGRMLKRSIVPLLALGAVFSVAAWGVSARAQDPFYYKGKTIRLVVGLAPGGGYDLYARVVARHLGKHIPGNPTIVVENMTGAGAGLERNVKEIFDLEPSLVAKLKEILK